jgi:hypothetical protein
LQIYQDPELGGDPEIYTGLVLGVGKGTFFILFFSFIGMILCCTKHSFQDPRLIVLLAFALPLITFITIWLLPLKSLPSERLKAEEIPEDIYLLRTGFFLFLAVVGFLALSCYIVFSVSVVRLEGRRVRSTVAYDFREDRFQEDPREEDDFVKLHEESYRRHD